MTVAEIYTVAQFIFVSGAIVGWFTVFVYCKLRGWRRGGNG